MNVQVKPSRHADGALRYEWGMSDVSARPRRQIWPTPTLRGDHEGDRRVGWLELFFDLVFVVIVSVLAQDLVHHPTGNGVQLFALKFLAVFWIWNGFTYYSERFESDGLDSRVFTFLGMLAIAGLAVWGTDGLGHNYLGFALSYVAARFLNIGMWLRAGFHSPVFRATALSFVGGFVVVLVLLGASFVVDEKLRPVVWGAAILVDMLTPAVFNRVQWKLPPISRDKYPERFGLLTMILLGEVISSVIGGIAEVNGAGELTAAAILNGAIGMAIGFGLWWIYYDFVGRRIPFPPLPIQLAWLYLHFFLLIGLVAVGVGVEVAVAETAHGTLGGAVPAILVLAESLTLATVGVMEFTLERGADEPTDPVISPLLKIGVAVLLLPLLAWPEPPVTGVLALGLLGLVVPAVYGTYVWFRRVR
jgi:low temperature requirement protein LtrA